MREFMLVLIFRPSVYMLKCVPSRFVFLLHHPYRGSCSHAIESMWNCVPAHEGYSERTGRLAVIYFLRNSRKYVAVPSLWSMAWKCSSIGWEEREAYSSSEMNPALFICDRTTFLRSWHRSGYLTGLK